MDSLDGKSAVRFCINPGRIVTVLGGVATALAVISFALHALENELGTGYSKWLANAVKLLSVDYEGNIPTWYSTVLLLACASVMALLAATLREKERMTSHRWGLLAAIFGLMSLDEAAGIHDRLGVPLGQWLNVTGFLSFAWVIPGALFVLAFLLLYARFFLQLPTTLRIAFFIAGVLYVGGALGFEAISANQVYVEGDTSLMYFLVSTVEELLEMWGVIVLFYGLLTALVGTHTQVIVLALLDNCRPVQSDRGIIPDAKGE